MISREEILNMNLNQLEDYVNKNPEEALKISSVLRSIAVKSSLNDMKNIFRENI